MVVIGVGGIGQAIDGTRITATLDDNATSKDFASLLPLTLSLDDYNGTEKISDLPKKLTTRWCRRGRSIPSPGISRTTHRGANLAIFYKDFEYSRGLVKLARSSLAEQEGAAKLAAGKLACDDRTSRRMNP